ncbi:hypothetical protein GCM10023196_036110 [Actinoallomurus vinaceus]|uniref:Uncharacterized protein n=1 Tax=Actinoallomurus vinaceus TaxID=1080074 RepID=A0ABP8UCS4_9ACTN
MSAVMAALSVAGSAFSFGGLALVILRWSDLEARHLAYGLYAIGNWLSFIYQAVGGDLGWAVFDGSLAAFYTWLWWRGRRNGRGKRVAKELGAKSRARIEVMARRMTPSPIPTPAGA